MRVGVNPEKLKEEKLQYWEHRVVIPVYIPNFEEAYYKNSFEVFRKSIESLLKTIDTSQTAITIINNNCAKEITEYVDNLLEEGHIQKHAKYVSNVGKVYPVLSEVRGVYEEYVTIADADILYMDNWVSETAKIFNAFSKAAMVSPLPCPSSFDIYNKSLVVENFFRIKKGKVVDELSFDLFIQGVNPRKKFFEGKKWNWRDKQYYLEKNETKTCVGAMHFIATYRKSYLEKIPLNRPEFVFLKGDECTFIEKHIDQFGGYRLSTIRTHAYHIGNTMDDFTKKYSFSKVKQIEFIDGYVFKHINPLRNYLFRIIVKVYQVVFRYKNK